MLRLRMPKTSVLSTTAITRRARWIDEIVYVTKHFGSDSTRVQSALTAEIKQDKIVALLDHLHLCGSIPESYDHDSGEEKLYSKYTDALLAAALAHLGLTSVVLTERANTADVEAVGKDISMVGDAKVFRLSRTAKNQKDFKVDALHRWKHGKTHAMVCCPIYQLPTRTSQIYQQAIAQNVCIFTYSHLAVLVRLADLQSKASAQKLLLKVLNCAVALNPTRDAVSYWQSLNDTMLSFHKDIRELWNTEKLATIESIAASKQESLRILARQREAMLQMTHSEAIQRLIEVTKLDSRKAVIKAVQDNDILSFSTM